MDLEAYLREIYPKASNRSIKKYLTLIENYDIDKLPETQAAKDFKKLKVKKKALEAKEEDLKRQLHEQYRNLGHQFGGINFVNTTSRTYDKIKFFDWVATLVPAETLEELTIRTIDEEKFNKLEKKGIIQYDELPSEVYTKKEGLRIDIEGSRKRTKKND